MAGHWEKFQNLLKGLRSSQGDKEDSVPEKIEVDVGERKVVIYNIFPKNKGYTWSQIRDKVGSWGKQEGNKHLNFSGIVDKLKEWLESERPKQARDSPISAPSSLSPDKKRELANGEPLASDAKRREIESSSVVVAEAGDNEVVTLGNEIAMRQPNAMAVCGAKFMIEHGLSEDQLVSIVKKCGLQEMLTDKLANTVLNLDKMLVSSQPEKVMVAIVNKYDLKPALAQKIWEKSDTVVSLVHQCNLKENLVDKICDQTAASLLVRDCGLREKVVDKICERYPFKQLVSDCDLNGQLVHAIVENESCSDLVDQCNLEEGVVDKICEKYPFKQLASDCNLEDELVNKIFENADNDDENWAAGLVDDLELKDVMLDKILQDHTLSDIVSQCSLKADLSKRIREATREICAAISDGGETSLCEVVSKYKLEQPVADAVLKKIPVSKENVVEFVSRCQLGAPLVDKLFKIGISKDQLASVCCRVPFAYANIATKIVESYPLKDILNWLPKALVPDFSMCIKEDLATEILEKYPIEEIRAATTSSNGCTQNE